MTAGTTVWRIDRVAWDDPRAARLRESMDAELSPRYADRFAEFESRQDVSADDFAVHAETIVATVLAVDDDGVPVGHAALRRLGDDLEVKRVFVDPAARGTGASRALMVELENIGRAAGASRLILQTGDRQPEAVALYTGIGYSPIPIFPPYTPYAFSLCFEKRLVPAS
ncbi:MAG: GNAT family N-acetyltransferase [Microbacterium sp.]